MIIVDYNDIGIKRGLWQYDFGQVLRIQGGNLKSAVEIHFSLQETGGEAVTRIGTTKDGVTDVVIPDTMLINDDIDDKYNIYVFIYIADRESGETEKKFALEVKSRPKPEAFDATEDKKLFEEAIKAVNESAERAETAEQQAAKHAEQTKLDAQQTTADRQEVKKLVESVSGIGEQVETVKEYKEQAQTAATNALLSEQKSERAKELTLQAQAGAETMADEVEQHALEVAGDKSEVERLATQVRQDKSSVEQTKTAVDKTAQDFTLTAQQALADVNNAGQTQTERVQSAGTTAVENIKTAQNTATREVETAKVEAVKAVQTEGTTQTGTVTAEGEKQVQAVQGAAQEIIADREQIQTNKTDIADLRQTKAGAIVESANGETIVVRDSSDNFFEDFRVFGKSEQGGNPSPDNKQDVINIGGDGIIEIEIGTSNILPDNDVVKTVKNYKVCTKNGFLLKKGVKYVLSTNENATALYINDFDKQEKLCFGYNTSSIEYTPPKNIKAFFDYYNANGLPDAAKMWLNIYTAQSYEPYKEPQTITLQTQNGLPGLKTQSGGNYMDSTGKQWICDEISVRDGVFGILKNLNMVHVKNCEESFAIGEHANGQKYVGFNASNAEANYVPMSDRYIGSEWTNTNNKIYVPAKGRAIITDNRFTDLETVKTIIRQENPCILYKVNTPVFEPFSEEVQQAYRALHTYYPNTTVTNDAGAHMEVEYVADTKTYIDKIVTAHTQEIVTAHTQGIANLLSLMPLSVQAGMVEKDTNNILENVEEMKHE